MRENKVKTALRENRLALGTYVTFADPQIVEIIGLAGYDAAFIDMEHTTFDLGLVTEMIRAADLVGVTSMIRIPGNDEHLILRLLDAGAEGIIIPHIDGLEGAKRAVEAVRYAPMGGSRRSRRHTCRPFRNRIVGRAYANVKRADRPVGDDRRRKGHQRNWGHSPPPRHRHSGHRADRFFRIYGYPRPAKPGDSG